MDQKSFKRLAAPRAVNRPDLPLDLARFYAKHEGVGLESTPKRIVRLCRLNEVTRIGWRDLHILGAADCLGWEDFAGYRIGISSFFDELVYVLHAPSCKSRAILALGVDTGGTGGSGPAALESTVVLAPNFPAWLRLLEQTGWVDYGLVPGSLTDLPKRQQQVLIRYYQALNPEMTWEMPE
jgi:hypothetical protein